MEANGLLNILELRFSLAVLMRMRAFVCDISLSTTRALASLFYTF